jgi:pyridoxal phosphate enzyme (YggS family)
LATKIDNALSDGKKLNIFVQVNTSAEESKGGVEPDQVVALCREIVETCPNLHLQGLMTIGAVGNVGCFDVLVQCRNDVADALQLPHDLGLSMGMSGDFRQAILKGATHVRVGSTIFGERDYSNTK